MKKLQLMFWVGVAVFVGHVAYYQDETPSARSYMARVDFINGVNAGEPVAIAAVDMGRAGQ